SGRRSFSGSPAISLTYTPRARRSAPDFGRTTRTHMLGSLFTLQLSRVRLRTQLAAIRSGAIPGVTPEATSGELEQVEYYISQLRGDASRPDLQLATALGLTDDEVDLIWAVVARAYDPLLPSVMQALVGAEATRKGLSVSHYATIM